MSAQAHSEALEHAPTKLVGEWFWRFLAVVLLFSVGWVLWVAYQLNPPMLVTKAAFEAAEKARANQSSAGVIVTKPEVETQNSDAVPDPNKPEAEASKPEAEPVAKEPPVNLEKLKLSDSITAPLAQDAKKK